MIDDAIAQFGEAIGMQGLALTEDRKLRLAIEDAGHLSLIHQPPYLLLGFSVELPLYEQPSARSMLEATHPERRLPRPVFPQRRGDRVGFAVFLDDEQLEASHLSEWSERLISMLEEARQRR